MGTLLRSRTLAIGTAVLGGLALARSAPAADTTTSPPIPGQGQSTLHSTPPNSVTTVGAQPGAGSKGPPTAAGAVQAQAGAKPTPPVPVTKPSETAGPGKPGTVAYGRYMAIAADCMPCHTGPDNKPFSGGLIINTPFGSLSSPNITPDPDTGIGRWTDEQFYAALHNGIGAHGEYLYPVMPFTSYTEMTKQDVLSIKRYLFSLKPVYAPRAPSGMHFPFNIRQSLFGWRELYFRPHTFKPDPNESAAWNRGAYLVQAVGHCGECHSPRNALGAVEVNNSLSGGEVDHWLAPNISSDPLQGIGAWPISQIVTFLKTGAATPEGVAFGPMAEVVHDSLSQLTDADLTAIATYLKQGPDRKAPLPQPTATAVDLDWGARLYADNCAQCHQANGSGVADHIPSLAHNGVVNASSPHDVIMAVLQGAQGPYGAMPAFAGALTDQDIADIANHVRTSWGNHAPANATAKMVEAARANANVGPAGSEAARKFDCPKVGESTVPGAVASLAEANLLGMGGDADLNNRMGVLIHQTMQDNPGISAAQLIDKLNAAACPAVANDQGLDTTEKREALERFNTRLRAQVAALNIPNGTQVLATVPLSTEMAEEIRNKAAAAHETPQEYMRKLLTSGQGGNGNSGNK